MYYAPHILQKRIHPISSVDEFGRMVVSSDEEEWETICACRCDRTSQTLGKSDNGDTFHSDYRICCSGRGLVKAGDMVRALIGNVVLCEGEARSVRETNYLDYTEVLV